jgi:hypothetical protein
VSDLLKDIQAYLIAGGLGTADGTDLFRDKIPDSPDAIIVLSEYIGSPGSLGIGASDRSVQVIVRHTTYTAAKLKSWNVYKRLVDEENPIKNFTLTRWGIVHSRHTPIKFEEDSQARILFVFNLGITTAGD